MVSTHDKLFTLYLHHGISELKIAVLCKEGISEKQKYLFLLFEKISSWISLIIKEEDLEMVKEA